MKINVLPSEIANMIAAGEVVERPASVVKELVENCVDAGASSITVEIKKGGITYIRVTDNGSGIAPDEIEKAFFRHATSKISSAADLESIYTLGFRGEALASIAAVARVETFSKTKDASVGRCVVIEGGAVLENDEAGCADGTTMIVRNLFFNTPARMKFLKNDATETGYVTDVVTKLILSHPEIAVQYINNGKTILKSNGDGSLLNAIYTVFGKDYSKNMTEVSYTDEGMTVTGYIGNSYLARKDRRHQIFFVNSRNIVCKTMSAAVSEAYKNTVMTGRFPVCILKAEVNANSVDVNVHPTKMEVRFSDEKKVYNLIYWAVKNALSDKKYIPEIQTSSKMSAPATGSLVKNAPSYDGAKQMELNILKDVFAKKEEPIITETLKAEKAQSKSVNLPNEKITTQSGFFKKPPADDFVKKTVEEIKKEFDETEDTSRFNHIPKEKVEMKSEIIKPVSKENPVSETPASQILETKTPVKSEMPKADLDFVLVGQIFGTYIILQKDNEMLIIDQHAAHERIYFEKLYKEFEERGIQSQLLLLPVTMTLNAIEFNAAIENKDFFEKLGFEVDAFGETSIIVRSTPDTLEEQDIKDAISDIISMLMQNKNNIKKELAGEALHIIACKRALKGNHVMTEKEMKSLAEQVLALEDGINTCPHGRPIIVKMSKYNLEKQFKRLG